MDSTSLPDQSMELTSLPRHDIRAVFTDLDDTLTDDSQMRSATYEALWRLHQGGLRVVIVSGRPAGWGDCLMRLWPLDALIFENGAGLLWRDGRKIRLEKLAQDRNRDEQRAILEAHYQALKREIPTLKLASDQPYRLFDYALDYAEEPPALGEREVERCLAYLRADPRITVKLSSIHINYWYGTHTKVTACRMWLERFGKPDAIDAHRVVFCGDSPNDEPLFEFFPHSVGVANIAKFLDRLTYRPKYLTKKPSGSGFQEVVAHLLTR
jgi:HAD superfamily hydrolase (TIGR01484 family)